MPSEVGKWGADVARHPTSLCGAGCDGDAGDAESNSCFVLSCFVFKGLATRLRAILQVLGISVRMRPAPSAGSLPHVLAPVPRALTYSSVAFVFSYKKAVL